MPLELRKRHQQNCPKYQKGSQYSTDLNCKRCVYIAFGRLKGKKVRVSLETTDRQEAAAKLLQMEAEAKAPTKYTVAEAVQRFLKERQNSGFKAKSIQTYRYGLESMAGFLAGKGVTQLRHVTVDNLSDWKATWNGSAASTKQKRQERIRTFFDWCHKCKYIDDDPTDGLTTVKVEGGKRERFTDEEVVSIFEAIPEANKDAQMAAKVRAFLLVLRYTALRIGDVTDLQKSHITEDRVFLYTAKTGQPVYTVVPAVVLEALRAIENGNDHYFYPGNPGTLETWKKKWSMILEPVYQKAGVKHRSHAWRDTLVFQLLRGGASIEIIARLLGHSSTAITWKHYSAWVPELQEQLENTVRRILHTAK